MKLVTSNIFRKVSGWEIPAIRISWFWAGEIFEPCLQQTMIPMGIQPTAETTPATIPRMRGTGLIESYDIHMDHMDRSLAPGHTFLAPYYFEFQHMWKLHHSKTYDELRYNFFALFLDVQRFFQDFPWDFPLDQMAQLRSRWRVALGGAQLDPAMRVAELSVEDLVKLCNALERLRGTLKSGAFSVFFLGWSAICLIFLEILGNWIKLKILIQGLLFLARV